MTCQFGCPQEEPGEDVRLLSASYLDHTFIIKVTAEVMATAAHPLGLHNKIVSFLVDAFRKLIFLKLSNS